MKLKDALELVRQNSRRSANTYAVQLACGFTPLHLQTFLVARLTELLPERRIECRTGLYGDLAGVLAAPETQAADAVAVVMEWPDLDPRLGYRRLGGWGQAAVADILASVETRLAGLRAQLETLAAATRVSVVLPTLPLPPAFLIPAGQTGAAEWRLRALLASFAAGIAGLPNLAVASPEALDRASPPDTRHDLRSDLAADFPYRTDHAAALAAALAGLIRPAAPLKGIITDLDDTFWRGLVGEVGTDAVTWDLDSRSQMHGLYQQMLAALADAGVLVAIASKNDPAVVSRALARADLRIKPDLIYPIEVSWNPKSAAVGRILETWNIGADAVVFVDDSPIELAEVERTFPGIRTMRFPTHDDAAILALIRALRDLFGKQTVTAEDKLRRDSIRQSALLRMATEDPESSPESRDEFLASLGAGVTADFRKSPADTRAFELINKTNQFNLNGARIDPAEWRRLLEKNDSFVLAISYADKFGELGKIAVAAGEVGEEGVAVKHWVLSCRAFSRRIEHQTLKLLFDRFDAEKVHLDYRRTERNGPTGDFLRDAMGVTEDGPVTVSRADFFAALPALPHEVTTHV
jgi:FkbH-like protein